MNCIQAAEKPLIFIFTYLERHWIDRQIQDHRTDILPMKQLLWQRFDASVLTSHWPSLLQQLQDVLERSWEGSLTIDDLQDIARIVNYLRVISAPAAVESDFSAAKRVPPPGLLINSHAPKSNRFGDFVTAYRAHLEAYLQRRSWSPESEGSLWIQELLQFWNDEEGRMVYLRFDKAAQVEIRASLKAVLLLPRLDSLKSVFQRAIMDWNVLEANAVYRLLANRRSLLANLDAVAEEALTRKGLDYLMQDPLMAAHQSSLDAHVIGQQFITLLGQFYNLSTELIQTALASRPEIFDARSRALKTILNGGKRAKFAATSLAICADYVVTTFPVLNAESEQMLEILVKTKMKSLINLL